MNKHLRVFVDGFWDGFSLAPIGRFIRRCWRRAASHISKEQA